MHVEWAPSVALVVWAMTEGSTPRASGTMDADHRAGYVKRRRRDPTGVGGEETPPTPAWSS
jgi:hypothetical protein